MWVFIGTMAVLLLPKLIGLAAGLLQRRTRRGCGGAVGLIGSVLVETVLAGLVAPIAMLFQTAAVASILAGRDSGWNPQRRDDGAPHLREIAAGYVRYTGFGAVLAAIAYVVSPFLVLWMSPVVFGLLLAVPLAALTGARGAGRALRQGGLLLTPEERQPPPVLAEARLLRRSLETEPADIEAAARLLADPALLAAHRAMLPPPRRPRIDPIDAALLTGLARLEEAETLADAIAALSVREKAAVLADARGIDRLAALGASGLRRVS
jgi:membrane glycosyltransferase